MWGSGAAHLYVFYVSWRLWEAHLYVFYVSGGGLGGSRFRAVKGPGGSAKEDSHACGGMGRGPGRLLGGRMSNGPKDRVGPLIGRSREWKVLVMLRGW